MVLIRKNALLGRTWRGRGSIRCIGFVFLYAGWWSRYLNCSTWLNMLDTLSLRVSISYRCCISPAADVDPKIFNMICLQDSPSDMVFLMLARCSILLSLLLPILQLSRCKTSTIALPEMPQTTLQPDLLVGLAFGPGLLDAATSCKRCPSPLISSPLRLDLSVGPATGLMRLVFLRYLVVPFGLGRLDCLFLVSQLSMPQLGCFKQ